jgi:hypothetical protein
VPERPIALPPVVRERIMTTRIPFKVVAAPAAGVILKAPPVLKASEHSVDFICGRCGAVLLHADEGQVHGILCESYNSTDG